MCSLRSGGTTNFIPNTVKTTIYGHCVPLSKTDVAVHKTQYPPDNRNIVDGFHYISIKFAASAPARTLPSQLSYIARRCV